MQKTDKLTIRNSTAEFLIFEAQSQADSIEVRYEDETLWLTQKMMAALFNVNVPTSSKHLQPEITISKQHSLEMDLTWCVGMIQRTKKVP